MTELAREHIKKIDQVVNVLLGCFEQEDDKYTFRRNNLVVITGDNENLHEEELMEYRYKGHLIRMRPDGRYESRVTLNRKRQSIYGNTIAECKDNLKKFLQQPLEKKFKISFYAWIEQWIIHYKSEASSNTISSIRYLIKNHVYSNIEDMDLKKITPSILNECIAKVPTSNIKEKCSIYLVDIMKSAFLEGLIKKDLSRSILKYKHTSQGGKALTVEERNKLLDYCWQDKDYYIFIFYMFTGARKLEALNFAVSDIIDDNFIRLPGTKTKESDRLLPKFEVIKILLNRLDCKIGKVFDFAEKTLRRRLIKLRAALGFDFAIKDLRTTFGTICAEIGIEDKVIAKWMGHTSESTTKKYYIKVLSSFEQSQISKFDHNFDPKKY